eukprot:PhF_6_TR35039/c0_g1_i1/m.51055
MDDRLKFFRAEPYLVPYEPYTGPKGSGPASSCPSGTSFMDCSRDAKLLWDGFYRNHKDATPYPDRHYLLDEFPEILSTQCMLEVGCGLGSTVVPLLQHPDQVPQLKTIVCVDLSAVAVKRFTSRPECEASLTGNHRITLFAHTLDVSAEDVPKPYGNPFDVITLIFCLSAVPPPFMGSVLRRLMRVLKNPGGVLFFRDYAGEDMAKQRLEVLDGGTDEAGAGYLRGNGTLSYFFETEQFHSMVKSAAQEENLIVDIFESKIVSKDVLNRKQGVEMHRG